MKTLCPIVKSNKTIRQYVEDLKLALTIASYAIQQRTTIVVLGVPSKYLECLNHIIAYLRMKYIELKSLIIHLTGTVF